MIVTGVGLDPDCSGDYEVGGLHGGLTYYQRCDLAYYMWYDGASYILSTVLGVEGAAYWECTPPGGPQGDYQPWGTAAGVATVVAA